MSTKLKGNDIMQELLTVREVAKTLRVDTTTVRRWAKQGTLEVVVLPHVNERMAYRVKRQTLNKILGKEETPTDDALPDLDPPEEERQAL